MISMLAFGSVLLALATVRFGVAMRRALAVAKNGTGAALRELRDLTALVERAHSCLAEERNVEMQLLASVNGRLELVEVDGPLLTEEDVARAAERVEALIAKVLSQPLVLEQPEAL